MICLKFGTSGRTVGEGTGLDVDEGTGVGVAVGRAVAVGGIVSDAGRVAVGKDVHAARLAIRRQIKITVALGIIESLADYGTGDPALKNIFLNAAGQKFLGYKSPEIGIFHSGTDRAGLALTFPLFPP